MKPDGGPAFPHFPRLTANSIGPNTASQDGMSLRDYFAIHAPEPVESDIASESGLDRTRNPHNDSYKPKLRSREEIKAYLRYHFADAMLAERGKQP